MMPGLTPTVGGERGTQCDWIKYRNVHLTVTNQFSTTDQIRIRTYVYMYMCVFGCGILTVGYIHTYMCTLTCV